MSKYSSILTGCKPDKRAQLLASLPSDLPDSFFSPSAKKTAPVLGSSGAGLVGLPSCFVFVGQFAQAGGWWATACGKSKMFDDTHGAFLSHRVRAAYRG